MGTEHLEWGIEGMGPVIKGSVLRIWQDGWWIEDDDGKKYAFGIKTCINGSATFSALDHKMRVVFNKFEWEKWLVAVNVAFDTSEETSVLVPKTETAVAGILDFSASKEAIADSPECSLEDEAFRVDSTNWNELILEDFKGGLFTAKANQGKDICELPNGVQLFTPNAMARELILSGRVQDMMTGDQAQWLLKNTPNNIPEGCEFAGFINSKDGKLHFNGETACYWTTGMDEKGNPKALFCIDISKVDEEMRPYTDEMIISDYDMESMMQVRLLKNSNELPPPPEVVYVDPSIFQKTE